METADWETSPGRCYKNIRISPSLSKQKRLSMEVWLKKRKEVWVALHTLQTAQTVVEAASATPTVGLEATVTPAETHFELFGHITTAAEGSVCQTRIPQRSPPGEVIKDATALNSEKTHSLLRNQTKQAVCKNQAIPEPLDILFRLQHSPK